MTSRVVTVLASALLLCSVLASGAFAGVGAAIDLGHLNVAQSLRPGSALELPLLHVRNPGDVTGVYAMSVAPLENGGEVSDDWVTFDPPAFTLQPGDRQPVQAILTVPAGTRPGSYEFLLRAGVSLDRTESGIAGVSAGAASRVALVVSDASVLGSLRRFGERLVTDLLPWTLGLLGFVAVVRLGRRFRIQVVPR